MKPAKPCNDRFDDIVAFVMGALDSAAAVELQEHIARCDGCRQIHGVLMEEEREVRAGFETLASGLGPIEQRVLEQQEHPSRVRIDVSNNHFLERIKTMILAHKRLSVAAAAVVTALAAGLILYVSLVSSPTTAYALEQTVEANERVVSYHAKITPAAELGEVWVQLGPDGTPVRARWDIQSPDDGAKVVVFSEGKAEIWFKDKKSHVFLPEKDGLRMVMKQRSLFDPKLAFEELQTAKASGKAQVETKEPSKKGDPITLTVTSKDTPDRREIYEVDPKNKLVKRVTHYRRQGDQWEQVSLVEYLDYNKEIDPKVFQLDLPQDVTLVDQIKQKPGLVKGNLSDKEIAVKAVREFFEAMIAKDYAKAGMIYSGMPAAAIEKQMAHMNWVRIVSIGEPVPHKENMSLRVPCKIAMRRVIEIAGLARQVYGRPDHWEFIHADRNLGEPLAKDRGIPQGDLSDKEIAVKVVREYWEAMIAEDYPKAGTIFWGIPAAKMTKSQGKGKICSRIISIGDPVPHKATGAMRVPYKIEGVRKNGEKSTLETEALVRQVRSRPDHWEMIDLEGKFDETSSRDRGMAKGDLSDKDIAVKVVREFFEALSAGDYTKAGMIDSGTSAAETEKHWKGFKILRIISVGEPLPHEPTDSLCVPCKIEIEMEFEPYGPFVRPVYNQPDRWEICGGI